MTTDDGYGNVEGDWSAYLVGEPARIIPRGGDEEILAQRLEGVTAYEIQVRAHSGTVPVRTGDRVVDERSGATFNVRAVVNPDERRRMLALTCSTGDADG